MSRPDGWSVSPELTAPVQLGGLRFADPDVEHEYRAWRVEHVRTFTAYAMYAGAGAAALAWVAVLFGALEDEQTLALLLIPVIAALLVGGAVWTRTPERARLLMPAGCLANLLGGLLAVGMTYPTHDTAIMGVCVAMPAFFGLTMYRMPPAYSLAAVTPYLVLSMAVAIIWRSDGTIDDQHVVLGLFVPLTTLAAGVVVNLAIEWST
ncbi:MAG TPA: hypothetical protein VFE07_07500, partial [Marmoricola sp.]|nr:hypothetical protein [Marmoricola sp.]